MRPLLLIAIATLLGSCATELPLREASPTPQTLASLKQNQFGVWPLDRKPTATRQALERAPAKKMSTSGSAIRAQFEDDCVVREISWWCGKILNYEAAQPTYTIVVFRQPKDGDDSVLAKLQAAGLGPTKVLGLDNGVWLTSATADPNWVLRWLNGRVYSAVRAIGDNKLHDLLNFRTVADLKQLPRKTDKDQRHVTRCIMQGRQDTGDASWQQALGGFEREVFDELLAPHRDKMTAIDRRMAKARTLSDRAKLFQEIRPIVVATRTGAGTALPPVGSWHQRHYDDFHAEMKRLYAGEAMKSTALWSAFRIAREALTRKYWVSTNPKKQWNWKFYLPLIDYDERWVRVRDPDPYREFAKRLRWIKQSRRPPTVNVQGHSLASRDKFVALRREAGPSEFELPWLDKVAKWQLNRNVRGAASEVHAMSKVVSYLQQKVQAPAEELAALSQCFDCPKDRRKDFVALLQQRLLKSGAKVPAADRAVIVSMLTALARSQEFETTIAKGVALLDAARALPTTGSLDSRLNAYAALASRTAELGPACEYVAGQLSIPAGRELAKEAAVLTRAGHIGQAALLYLNAATLGSRTAPAPTSTWSAQRDESLLQQAERLGQLEGRNERRDWLIRARMLAYQAVITALPPTATSDPAFDLQERFIGSQLAGLARLSTAFGLRLGSSYDARKRYKKDQHVRLVQADGKIVWRRANEGGTAIDLGKYEIDKNGWREFRKLQRELREAEANMLAARKSGGASRESLKARRDSLNTEIAGHNEGIRNNTVNPAIARSEIERLQREQGALNAAISNFNRRQAHIRETTDVFNKKVGPHNDLLERLLAEQATAYEQLLKPAATEYLERSIVRVTKDEDERRARRWLLGLIRSEELERSLPVPHPSALAQRVRDVSDPTVAANDILTSLRRRLSNQRLWRGVTMAQHLDSLRNAITAYGRQYGVTDLHEKVLNSGVIPKPRHSQVVGFFTEAKRRAALKQLVDG